MTANAGDARLIVALDVPTLAQAESLVDTLRGQVSFFKIGYQLVPQGGIALAQRLIAAGCRVFLDLKYHDIGNTVEKGTASVAGLGVDFLTVHAEEDVVRGAVAGRGQTGLKILAVTVLTNQSPESLARAGIDIPLPDLVLRRAEMALENGADGVVASAREAPVLRRHFGDDFLIVTPGIRPATAAADDQKRVATPGDAIAAGTSHLVVGRPIVSASDPADAAAAILEEIRALPAQ